MDQVLYRKYRPNAFAEVVEQQHVVNTLSNALKMGKTAHAYLFCGPRGVGKTSIARIFAKAINCEKATAGDACNVCEHCRTINEHKTLDIIEIDAASNRGIDEVRNLQDRIKHPPAHLKYKVFIIDEVHMMTQGAFNALLKTLEEPPAHALFLFATTETHKVPATILSRCQRFDLKKVSLEELVKNLSGITQKEGVSVEPEALQLVALYADGCVRDAQSLLMQVLALSATNITLAQVKEILAVPDMSQVAAMIDALASRQTKDALLLVNKIADDGMDLVTFSRQVIDYLRKVLVAKINPDMQKRLIIEFSDAARDQFLKHAQQLSVEYVMKLLKAFVDASEQIKSSVLPQLPLELAITSFDEQALTATTAPRVSTQTTPQPSAPTSMPPVPPTPPTPPVPPAARSHAEVNHVERVEVEVQIEQSAQVAQQDVVAAEAVEEVITASNLTIDAIRNRWSHVVETTRKYNHSVSAFLQVCWPSEMKGNRVDLAFKFDFHKERIRDMRNKQIVEKVLDEVFAEKLYINCVLNPELVVKTKESIQNVESVPVADAAQEKQLLDQVLEVFGGKVVE